jgi:hypothetical protein
VLPTVQVRMAGEFPVVVGTSPPVEPSRLGILVIPSPQPLGPTPARPRGYVRSLR